MKGEHVWHIRDTAKELVWLEHKGSRGDGKRRGQKGNAGQLRKGAVRQLAGLWPLEDSEHVEKGLLKRAREEAR